MADLNTSMPVRITHDETKSEDATLRTARSMNNRLILESYQKEGLKSSVSNGFAFIEQKVSLKGLKVLMDAKLADGTVVPKGSTAYIKEETLHTQQWANKVLQCETFPGNFIIADALHVEFITPPSGDAA